MVAYIIGSATASRSSVDQKPGFAGFATGTAVHVDALQAGLTGPRVADVNLAFSAANTNSDGFTANRASEVQLNLQPDDLAFAGKNASARGSGLAVGLVTPELPADAGDLLEETFAGAVGGPNAAPDIHDLLGDPNGLGLSPLAYASLLHSEAATNWSETPCLSSAAFPISTGRGYAADAQVLDAGSAQPDGQLGSPVLSTDDPNPARSVVHSRSSTYARPNGVANRYGLVSEIRQTFAPVEILRGPEPALVIELLGEWVFRAIALGVADDPTTAAADDGSRIEYFVDNGDGAPVTPSTAVLRISTDGGLTYQSLDFQTVFSAGGLTLPGNPVLGLAIGEDPRAIANPAAADPDPASTPTIGTGGRSATGAVDAIRVGLLGVSLGTHAADLRVGHFEASAAVPANGFSCTAPPTSSSSSSSSSSSTSSSSTSSTSSTSTSSTSTSSTSTTIPASTSTVAPTTTTSTTLPPKADVAGAVIRQPTTVG